MKNGNPNPSPETRFKPGQSGNPGGISSETARLTRENAEAAARIRARLLHATEASLNERGTDEAMALIEAAMLKLLKDSEDRGLGAPAQAIDHSSKDGSMSPNGVDLSRLSDDALAELVAARDAASKD